MSSSTADAVNAEDKDRGAASETQTNDADALHEQWMRSPENLRSRGKYFGGALFGFALLYGGVALATVGANSEDPELGVAGGIALAVVGVGLFAYAFQTRSQARAVFYERQERAARAGVDDALEQIENETDLRGLLRLNRRQMEAYEALTRRQAASSYRLSHFALGLGFAVVVAGAVTALVATELPSKIAAASLATVAAAISGFIARTYLRIYERTLIQLNHYFEQPLVSSYVLTAERLVDKMSDDKRDEALSVVINELLGWRSHDAVRSSASEAPRTRQSGA